MRAGDAGELRLGRETGSAALRRARGAFSFYWNEKAPRAPHGGGSLARRDAGAGHAAGDRTAAGSALQ
jgi:hypothetical protein